jgi:DNA-binding response OmpR family regulator
MKSLLLLEEDTEGRDILSRLLQRRGFHVLPVQHESAALAVLNSGYPVDLVLAGAAHHERIDFLAAVRKGGHSLPVVFLSDYRDTGTRWRGLLGGFYVSRRHNVYVNARPIEFHELDRLIRIVPRPVETNHSWRDHAMNAEVA